jgi:NADH-quinone oxidoreductase subunit N
VSVDYHAILPELILAGTIMLVLIVDLFLPTRLKSGSMAIGLLGVLASLGAVLTLLGEERSTFGGSFVIDNFAVLFKVFFLAAAVIVLAVSRRYFDQPGYYQGEYYFLLLTSFLGCLLMPSSRDLLMLFISLELVSAPGFLMAAFRKWDVTGVEGGLKFFLIGVLSTAVMLFGMSLIYGLTGGETRLDAIATALGERWPWLRSCSSSWASRSRSPRSPSSSGHPTPMRARRFRSRRSWPLHPRRPASRGSSS